MASDSIEPDGKCCSARLLAAAAHERVGNHVRATEHMAAARREAADLARFGLDPNALSGRNTVYERLDGLDNKLDYTSKLRAARAADPRNPRLVATEAYNWLCLGNDREAELVAAETPGLRYTERIRIIAALSRADGRTAALRAYDKFDGSSVPVSYRLWAVPMLYSRDRARAVGVAAALNQETDRQSSRMPTDWHPYMAYLAGTLPERDLLANSPPSPVDRFFRHYFIGWKRLGDGDRAGARQAFEAAYQFKMSARWAWFLTRAVLIRMADPAWPQAISTP